MAIAAAPARRSRCNTDPRYSRYVDEEEQDTEAETRRTQNAQAMKTLGTLALLGLLIGAMSYSVSGSLGSSSYSASDGYAQRQYERDYQAQEAARQEHLANEARQLQQNCYGGCAW